MFPVNLLVCVATIARVRVTCDHIVVEELTLSKQATVASSL